MPSRYNRKIGTTALFKYPAENMEAAVRAVQNGDSMRKAAEKFQVPKTTLRSKILHLHPLEHGRPTALTPNEEKLLEEGLITCAEWGVPMTPSDICEMVKSYLDRSGRKEPLFKDNRPARGWMDSYLKRHPYLSKRFCENIKRKRAEISIEILNQYFDNLEDTLRDVPPTNLVNYDETNFSDDPGKMRAVVKRGSRHPELILDTSKSSVSVMFSVSASGHMLPPYVVYKSTHLYDTWTENAFPGTRFNRSASGWFDMSLLEDWFFKICLPYLKTLRGKKAIMGDNLASHLSLAVVEACEENDIIFILLPPNGTHLLQPLDVSFFHPLKVAWRAELLEWKKKNRGCLPKSQFPHLLNKTLQRTAVNSTQNITAGFKSCGLVPLNRDAVLKKIPGYMRGRTESNEGDAERRWSDTLIEQLQQYRCQSSEKRSTKKLKVQPGESVTSTLLENSRGDTGETPKKKKKKKQQGGKKRNTEEDSYSEGEDVDDPKTQRTRKKKQGPEKVKRAVWMSMKSQNQITTLIL